MSFGFVQRIYLALPSWAKNIAVTAYGIHIYRQRYSRLSNDYVRLLERTRNFDRKAMANYQKNRFVELAKDAVENVPFYRNWFLKNGISSQDVTSLESINLFPIIDKEDLRSNPEQFISDRYRKERLIKLSTSGSTGMPVSIYLDKNVRTFHYAFFTRLRGWYSVGKRDKRITFLGRIVVGSNARNGPFWVYDAVQRNLIMSSFHLSEKYLESYYRKIVQFEPAEIFGYTSSIYQIAKYIVEFDRPRIKVKLVMPTAETLLPYQRSVILQAFNCNLVNQYGCTEMAFFGSENPKSGSMLMHPEHSILEVQNSDGIVSRSGEGEVVATSLINEVMPLIRYKVGDRIIISSDFDPDFPCFTKLESLEGRTDDIVYTREGRPIARLSPIFRSDKCIAASQVIQEKDGVINIYVVPDRGYSSIHRKLIERDAKERIGGSFPVNIIEVDLIEKEPNGKFRPVKSFFRPN